MMTYKLAGAYSKFLVLKPFILDHLNAGVKFKVYDGIRDCSWNGGRVNIGTMDFQYATDFYKDHDIPICLAISNSKDVDIADPVGIKMLSDFNWGNNELILSNLDLAHFIRTDFPNYILNMSITAHRHSVNMDVDDKTLTHYRNMEHIFDIICPRGEHVLDPAFSTLDMAKYEVMLNEYCQFWCPHYVDHFDSISECNLKGISKECLNYCLLSDSDQDNVSFDLTTFSRDQYEYLQKIGVTKFKISGREFSNAEMVKTLNKYCY